MTKLLNSVQSLALATILGTTAAISATSVEAGTLDEIIARGELRVAVQTQGPPFSFINSKGERTGSAVKLAELMAEELGVKITFLDFDWDGLIPALLSGKADILAADMTPTLARATRVAFTKPFIYVGGVAFAKESGDYKSIADCGKPGTRIAVLLGSSHEKSAAENFPEAEIKAYKGGGTLVLDAVDSGQADCGVNDSSAVLAQTQAYPPGTFTVFPEMLTKEPLSYAVRYDSLDLLTWANLFIDTVDLDGRLKENLDYWVNSTNWKDEN